MIVGVKAADMWSNSGADKETIRVKGERNIGRNDGLDCDEVINNVWQYHWIKIM